MENRKDVFEAEQVKRLVLEVGVQRCSWVCRRDLQRSRL